MESGGVAGVVVGEREVVRKGKGKTKEHKGECEKSAMAPWLKGGRQEQWGIMD